MQRRHGIISAILLAGLAWVVVGCGSSDTVDVPKVDDSSPFEVLAVGTDSTLEVVTWNLKTFPYPQRADEGHDPRVTVERLIQAVHGLDADVYALQEIRSEYYFEAVVAGLEGWTGVRSPDNDYNLAYIYRNDGSLANVAISEIYQGGEYGAPFPRRPYVMTFEFDGVPVVVVNNHFKCCGDDFIDENDPWDETTRRRDASLLLEEYIDANMADSRVIVVGDFNDELDDATEGNVFATFLAAPERWRFLDLDIAFGPSSGWSFPGWPSHLDHILVTDQLFGAAEKQNALIRVVPMDTAMSGGMTAYNDDLSDHMPVEVRLDLD
ncbi:MAG: hypothetical protein GY838_07650 [bacterium]|nr:hypothetical protein [bacterium]